MGAKNEMIKYKIFDLVYFKNALVYFCQPCALAKDTRRVRHYPALIRDLDGLHTTRLPKDDSL